MITPSAARPTNKVAAGALAGALTVVLVWALKQFAHTEMPAEIAMALQVLITFGTQYVVTDAPTENTTP